jgi:hypothetical protein
MRQVLDQARDVDSLFAVIDVVVARPFCKRLDLRRALPNAGAVDFANFVYGCAKTIRLQDEECAAHD